MFFFKQKTAYELRISDWGSDVCSSDLVVNDLSGAAFGSAGERCMALPVVTPVGEKTANALREKLIPAMEALRVGVSTDPEAHYGPVVTAAHKAKVEGWIQKGVDEGA